MNLFLFFTSFILTIVSYGKSKFSVFAMIFILFINIFLILTNFSSIQKIFRRCQHVLLILILLFLFLLVISILRTNNETTLVWKILYGSRLLFFTFGTMGVFSSLLMKNKLNFSRNVFHYLILPSSIFIIINFLFYVLSIDPFSNMKSGNLIGNSVTFEAIFGFQIERPTFPLSVGINTFGIFVGAILILNLIFLIFYRLWDVKRLSSALFVGLFVFILFLLDTRSIIFGGFILLLCMLLLKLQVYKFLKVLFFGSLFFPIILVFASFLIGESDYLETIMRSKSDLLTGNNRFFIWAFVLEELSSFKFMHLVGYGELGHYGSKLSYEWMDFFKFSYDSPEKAASSHNTILQLILDTGYVGLVIYLAIIYKSFHHNLKLWKQSGSFFNLIIPFFIIYINIVGTTEAYFTDLASIVVFFLIMLFGLIFNNSYETKNH